MIEACAKLGAKLGANLGADPGTLRVALSGFGCFVSLRQLHQMRTFRRVF